MWMHVGDQLFHIMLSQDNSQYKILFNIKNLWVMLLQFFSLIYYKMQEQYQLYNMKSHKKVSIFINQVIISKFTQKLNQLNSIKSRYQQAYKKYQQQQKSLGQMKKISSKNNHVSNYIKDFELLKKRINLNSYPYIEVIQGIKKYSDVMDHYMNIENDGIEFSHIVDFKELNNIYMELQLGKNEKDVITNHELFLKKFEEDLNLFNINDYLRQIQKQLRLGEEELRKLNEDFYRQLKSKIIQLNQTSKIEIEDNISKQIQQQTLLNELTKPVYTTQKKKSEKQLIKNDTTLDSEKKKGIKIKKLNQNNSIG